MKHNLSPKEKKLLKKIHIKELLEVYANLLTEKEKRIATLYTDPSLNGSEIARRLKVSRQAVHDIVRRATNKMERCDEKSKLLEKRRKKIKVFLEMENAVNNLITDEAKKNELKKLLETLKRLEKE
ncbi:MAG: hypothetical protein K6343_02115 [Caldisericaceae bacterium]